MARARNIKPGFFENDDLVELSFEYRLLFIGLWTLADREGRLEDRPKRIKMKIFPADSVNIEEGLRELTEAGFLSRYVVDGVAVIQIRNFHKHQNPHHTEKASELPDENGDFKGKSSDKKVDNGELTVKAQESNGGNLADSGFTDSLIPDSLNPEKESAGKPAPSPAEPEKPKTTSGGQTLSAYIAECRTAGVKPVPDDHFIRKWAEDAGILPDMLALAWLRFREEHTAGARKAKRYKDWPGTFANSVKDRWYKLWTLGDGDATARWTPEGVAMRNAEDARMQSQQQQHEHQEVEHA